jgi:UDP-N-acetyl-2-amino-2-deoxyglucuronate dehydrogenase
MKEESVATMKRMCIVGCGKVAWWRVGAFTDIFDVTACVDSDKEKALGLAALVGKRKLLPKHLVEVDDPSQYDVAYIATPNGLHKKCAEPFINAGVPVVIEKPLALSDRDLFWMAAKAADGAWICGAYNSRYSPGVDDAVTQAIGSIVHIQSTKFRRREKTYYEDGWHGTWAYDGGVLAQQAIHCIDLVCWIAGRKMRESAIGPRRVAALGFRAAHDIECEDTGTILMDFGNFAGVVSGTTAAGRNGAASLTIITTGGCYGDEQWGWDDGAPILWQEIGKALREGLPPPVPVASTLPGLWTLHAAYLSIDAGGAWVDLGRVHPRLGVLPEEIVGSPVIVPSNFGVV